MLWPENPIGLVSMAGVQIQCGQNEISIKNLKKALVSWPRLAIARYVLIVHYYCKDQFDSAIETGNKFLEMHPQHPLADSARVLVYAARIQSSPATQLATIEQCDKALEHIQGTSEKSYKRDYVRPIIDYLKLFILRQKQQLSQEQERKQK